MIGLPTTGDWTCEAVLANRLLGGGMVGGGICWESLTCGKADLSLFIRKLFYEDVVLTAAVVILKP